MTFARLLILFLLVSVPVVAAAQAPGDTDDAAYTPSTLAKILGGAPRSQNDEAELASAGQWFHTAATFTGRTRPPSGRFRPLIGAWASSRGQGGDVVDMFFSGELPELEFEQGGRKYWVMAGMPGGLGFGVYPPGTKLTIYLQRVGFASGTPIAMLTLAKLEAAAATTAAARGGRRINDARVGEGARRQEAVFRRGSATFTYAGREYTLPLDVAGRHSVAPGLYRYENGVRTALLEYGEGDTQYLLLRVALAEGAERTSIVPYLVLNGRIVPPLDIGGCAVDVSRAGRAGAAGDIDCSGVAQAVLARLRFTAE